VTEAAAREDYGVVVTRDEKGTVVLDRPATEKLRYQKSQDAPASDQRVPALAQEVIAE
jgi:hypothetical protein